MGKMVISRACRFLTRPLETETTRSEMAGDSPDSSPLASPNKRLKTLVPELKSSSGQSDDGFESRRPENLMDEESGSPVCGICLSEGGKSIGGRIDSCDHCFCFVCIMEWAKVESRCPMCKQRFTSIRRPTKPGVFACERIVHVPQRDQVYHLFGNATTTHSDPYAETRCIVCRSMADESLLLLCDLCDSAAHSYCVGLGYTIPEGDWFCHDCAVSRAEHEKADLDVETENGILPEEYVEPAPMSSKVSIFDIVREADGSSLSRTLPRSTSLADQFSPPVSYGSGSIIANEETGAATRTHRDLATCGVTESCARTLSRCRNVHSRIQTLRENWNSLRNGLLRFSSGSGESFGGRHNEGYGSVLFSPNKQSRVGDGCVGLTGQEKKDPYNIEKAWKMMEMAKTAQNLGRTNGVCMVSIAQSGSGSKTEQPSKIRSGNHLSGKRQAGPRNLGSCKMKMQPKQNLSHGEIDQSMLQKLDKQKQIIGLSHLTVECKRGLSSSSSEFHECLLSRKVNVRTDNSGTPSSTEYVHKKSSNESHMQNGSSHCLNTADSTQGNSHLSQTKPDLASSSSSKAPVAEVKQTTEKPSARKLERKNDDAKTEVQSLVKLNLKLLTKGKQLGVNVFKEIARISTHTILAACGLDHSKPRVLPSPSPVCNHSGQTQQPRRSTFMPNSCRECFYAFVREVVQSVMDEKAKPTV